MKQPTAEPLSARLTWEEAHRLELLMRVRSRSLSQTGRPANRCAGCGRVVAEDGMRLAGAMVHPECISRAAHGPPRP